MDRNLAIDCLGKIMIAANSAGIAHAHFISFGTLLGAIRDGGPVEHDHDNDVGILADRIEPEQEVAYYHEVEKQGLFGSRRVEQRRSDTNRFLWFSCREKEDSVKCCSWFWQPYNGYYFHSKGLGWIQTVGPRLNPPIRSGEAILKGIRKDVLEELIPFDFCGIKVNIPKLYGTALDMWYPGWMIKKNDQSREEIMMYVPKWKEPKGWKIWIK